MSVDQARCGGEKGIPMPATQEALLPATAVISLIGEDIEWAKYRSNNACVGRHGDALSP